MKTKNFLNLKSWLLMMLMLIGVGANLWGQSGHSTDYTGNITLSTSGGSNADVCKIKINNVEYDGIKAGTSSKVGAVKITVPAGTKFLHLHVAGWKSETVTLAVTPNGYSEDIALTANDDITASSPFTIEGDVSTTEYYKVITFSSALSQNIDLTFTATGGKRFVIWGVTAEEESVSTTYSVTYNANGATDGSVPTDATEYSSGDEVTVLGNTGSLIKTGYSFDGWNTEANGSGDDYDADDTFTITANTTLYAQWIQDPYTVTLDDDSSTLTEASSGAGVTLPSRDGKAGYSFAGWSETNVPTETTIVPTIIPAGSYTPTGNITLYPVYSKTEGGGETTSDNIFSSGSFEDNIITWSINNVVSIKQERNGSSNTAPNSSYVSNPRWYSGNKITITPGVSINSISVTTTTEGYATALASSTYTNATANASGTAVTITPTNGSSVITIVMSGQSRLSSLTVNYSGGTTYYWSAPVAAAVEAPTFSLAAGTYEGTQNVEISCITQGATIYYTTDGSDPTSSSTLYSGAITIDHSCTLKAIAIKDRESSAVASASYVILDPNRPGTENNPYTVAQALEADVESGVYVKGIVSAVTEVSTQYHNVTYKISDDGTTSSDQFIVYRGKNVDNSNITSEDDVQVGDVVVVYGDIAEYQGANQLAQGNYLVSLIRPEKPKHNVSWSVNGKVTSTAEVEEGKSIIFPDAPEAIEGKTFVGWVAEAIDGVVDDAPAFVSSATMGTADVTYYAVFASQEGSGDPTWTETALSALTASDTFVIVGNGYAMPHNNGTSSAPTATAVTIDDSNLTSTVTDNIKWNVSGNATDGYTFYPNGDDKKWLYCNTEAASGSNNNMRVGTGDRKVFELDSDGYLVTKDTYTTRYLSLYNDQDFRGYVNTTNAIVPVFYKYCSNISYSDYCTTIKPAIEVAAPIVFHDSGTYREPLKVTIVGQGIIKYTLNGGAEQTYEGPIDINGETTLVAWVEQEDGVKSDLVTREYKFAEAHELINVEDGYYTIKNNGGDNLYVNVAGRKTVTFVGKNDAASMPGTVIRLKVENDTVKVLRSQGIDLPGYAERAMNYVPKIVQLVVEKLHAEGSGELLGENGLKAIMDKFNESFDYHLYLEKPQDGAENYRIYGRTPSMKPVVDFYAENKDNVDAKLPMLESFINSAIDKVLEKTHGSGASILEHISLENIWAKMGGTEAGLTAPVDEASTLKFYEQVLSSEANVWNFAYQTAMIYWGNLKNHPRFAEVKDKLGEYAKYIDRVENIQPDFRYYIVQQNGQIDFISEGNVAITASDVASDADFTCWSWEKRTGFDVAFDVTQVHTIYPTSGGNTTTYTEYYTTLYTDFAYTLPEKVKAYKVTEISEKYGVAVREEITGTIPAQTPVMLISETEGNKTFTLSTDNAAALTENLLVGADALINEYQLTTAQVKGLFDFAKDILGDETYATYLTEYEHLMLTNSGTVNNKYFFGLSAEDVEKCVVNKDCVIRNLSTDENEKTAFHESWEAKANKAFLVSEKFPIILLSLKGDVNRDGNITISDVTALVNIILGKATYPADKDKYDFEAANVNGDETITISDVTALVNIILGKPNN